ncbi:MAG TPA: hypothetical protein VK174_03000, partial [Chitinophagales bacterium]|nr:hypothetical protein [Chitinophagales bacterium]
MKKHMLPGTAAVVKRLSLATVVFVLFNASNLILAQCGFVNNDWGAITPGCGAFSPSFSLPSTSYATFTAVQGVNYDISTCGTGWDSQITGFDAFNNQIGAGQTAPVAGGGFYNDDNGSICGGTNASLSWTAQASGTTKVLVEQYFCGATWVTTSALLQIRQVTTITNTTSNAAICGDGSTKALSVSYAGTRTGNPAVTYTLVSG